MSDVPRLPTLSGGSPITIKERKILSLDCPKCKSPLDVTNLSFGTNIECPSCKNITWCPEFKPHWWFRLRNYLLSLLVSFVLGVAASLVAAHIYESNNMQQTAESTGKGELK
jgi:uncharacterized paraquat-inducible protein A